MSRAETQQITVNTPSRPYAVLYAQGLLARAGAALSSLDENAGVYVLSSPRVWRRWGRALEKGFRRVGGRVLFGDGEHGKTLRAVETISRALFRQGAGRRSIIVALGGGVVGDVAGFVAATYMRGVRLVHVPTTLLAQVDSAIGGKTGVNLPEGKNLVGAFYQPSLVLVDPEVLRTLPARQYRSGIYEVIKYGVIGDAELFAWLEKHIPGLAARHAPTLDWVIPRCIEAKARVASEDERESGPREALNFGHTFGHALEAATRYRRYLHGEAVGWGMIVAARLAVAQGMLAQGEAEPIERLVRRVGPLPSWPAVAAEKLFETMRGDKKSRAGKLRFVLPRGIGQVETGVEAPDSHVWRVLQGMTREG
jgi:3-dehydroquinate synthase